MGESSRPKLELPVNSGSLAAENLLEWINDLDKYFDYDEVEDNKRAKFSITRLKTHASLWWDSVKVERRKKNNPVIKIWDRWSPR